MASREATPERGYWHGRVRTETAAALACDDPHVAAIHVELATHCLKRAQREAPATPPAGRRT